MTVLFWALLGLGFGIAAYAGVRGVSRNGATLGAASRLVVAGLSVILGSCGLGGLVIWLSSFHGLSWLTVVLRFLATLVCIGMCLLMLGMLMWVGDVADHLRRNRPQHRTDASSAESVEAE